jgi:hypothetical protein
MPPDFEKFFGEIGTQLASMESESGFSRRIIALPNP